MSIKCEFTPRNTMRIECGGEVVEVVLPGGTSSVDPGQSTQPSASHGDSRSVGLASVPQKIGRPKQGPGVMAIIADEKSAPSDFDWFQVGPDVHLEDIQAITAMNNAQLASHFSNARWYSTDGPKIVDIGISPYSGTTPEQLGNLRRIVEDKSIDIDAVRLFKLPDLN